MLKRWASLQNIIRVPFRVSHLCAAAQLPCEMTNQSVCDLLMGDDIDTEAFSLLVNSCVSVIPFVSKLEREELRKKHWQSAQNSVWPELLSMRPSQPESADLFNQALLHTHLSFLWSTAPTVEVMWPQTWYGRLSDPGLTSSSSCSHMYDLQTCSGITCATHCCAAHVYASILHVRFAFKLIWGGEWGGRDNTFGSCCTLSKLYGIHESQLLSDAAVCIYTIYIYIHTYMCLIVLTVVTCTTTLQ